jgi:hypothetical protein
MPAASAVLFSTHPVDFLSIKLGIGVCRDICGLENTSSIPRFGMRSLVLILTASITPYSRHSAVSSCLLGVIPECDSA